MGRRGKGRSRGKEDRRAASESSEGGESEEKEDEVIRVEPERADFEAPAAFENTLDSHHEIVNNLHAPVIIKLKCTDLDHFTIKPGTALLKPGGTVKLRIERLPHKSRKDQKVDIYYMRYRGDDAKPNIGALFKKKGESANHITLLLRIPKETPVPGQSARKVLRPKHKGRSKQRADDEENSRDDDPPHKRREKDEEPPPKRRERDEEPPPKRRERDEEPPPKRRERDEEAPPPKRRERDEEAPPPKRRESDDPPPKRREKKPEPREEPDEISPPKPKPKRTSKPAPKPVEPEPEEPKEEEPVVIEEEPPKKAPAKKEPPKIEKSSMMSVQPSTIRKLRQKPPPLELEDPNLRCIFFPPFNEANQISFAVVNPSDVKRVAVKMKCSDLSQFDIKPTYMFLGPKKTEEIVVKRNGVGPPKSGKKPELLAIYNIEVGKTESEWKAAFKDAQKEEMSEVQVELEVRNDPYLDARDSIILFHKPHSLKSVSTLALTNISPFYAVAKCYCGNNETYRVNPVRMLIGPSKTQLIHFSVAKLPILEAKIQVDYAKTTEEVAKRDPKDAKLKELVDSALKRRESGEVFEVHAVLRACDDLALTADPDTTHMRWIAAESKWFSNVTLRNLSSANVAVKVKALDPKRYIMGIAKMVLEPFGDRELTITEKTEEGRPGDVGESVIKLEFAYCVNPNKRPDAVLTDAKGREGALASIRVTIKYDTSSHPALRKPGDPEPRSDMSRPQDTAVSAAPESGRSNLSGASNASTAANASNAAPAADSNAGGALPEFNYV